MLDYLAMFGVALSMGNTITIGWIAWRLNKHLKYHRSIRKTKSLVSLLSEGNSILSDTERPENWKIWVDPKKEEEKLDG